MALSKQEIEHYHETGYVIPKYRLPEKTLESIRVDYDRLLTRHPEFRDYCPMLLRYDLSFLNYARDPNILDMVEQVIGADIILWNSSFFAKPAENGKKNTMASGWRILATTAARNLHSLASDRRRNGGERLPQIYARITQKQKPTTPSHQQGSEFHPPSRTVGERIRRRKGSPTCPRSGPDIAARRLPIARIGSQ
jgi:hypothetical protein